MKRTISIWLWLLLTCFAHGEDRLGETMEELTARWGESHESPTLPSPPATAYRRFHPAEWMFVDVEFWENRSCKFIVIYSDRRNPLQEGDVPLLLKQLSGGGAWKEASIRGAPTMRYERDDGKARATFYLKDEYRQLLIETTAFIEARQAAKDKARKKAIEGL